MRLEGRGLISFFMLFYVQKSLFHYLFINLCQAKKVQFCYLRKIFFHKIPKKVSRRDYNHLQHLNWVHICWIGQNPEKYFLWILSLGSILSEGSVRPLIKWIGADTLICRAWKFLVQRLWVIWGQCCLRVAGSPCLPNGPIKQLSPHLIQNPCML